MGCRGSRFEAQLETTALAPSKNKMRKTKPWRIMSKEVISREVISQLLITNFFLAPLAPAVQLHDKTKPSIRFFNTENRVFSVHLRFSSIHVRRNEPVDLSVPIGNRQLEIGNSIRNSRFEIRNGHPSLAGASSSDVELTNTRPIRYNNLEIIDRCHSSRR